MSLWLANLPENSQVKTIAENDWGTYYFIIDQAVRPDALEKLYQVSGTAIARRLFDGTDYEGLSDIGPIWVAVNGCHETGFLAATICQESLAGIAVSTQYSEESAIVQAQYLLTMHCDGFGESLCRYYDPRLWHALATSLQSTKNLMGEWDEVLAPFFIFEEEFNTAWLSYRNIDPQAASYGTTSLAVGSETLLQHKEFRWQFWLAQNSKLLPYQLNSDRLRATIDNLQLLVDCGISESRHLRRLLPVLPDQSLTAHSEKMAILNSGLSLRNPHKNPILINGIA
ncbi:DUF4123 domain-containing protein [Pseudomonas sp. NCHU5208]|uniref:DUF4123 domain-containing protein n=1 Tax=unclassified Pseudomonas TaxID=196821 RepID=UPI003F9DE6AC